MNQVINISNNLLCLSITLRYTDTHRHYEHSIHEKTCSISKVVHNAEKDIIPLFFVFKLNGFS